MFYTRPVLFDNRLFFRNFPHTLNLFLNIIILGKFKFNYKRNKETIVVFTQIMLHCFGEGKYTPTTHFLMIPFYDNETTMIS